MMLPLSLLMKAANMLSPLLWLKNENKILSWKKLITNTMCAKVDAAIKSAMFQEKLGVFLNPSGSMPKSWITSTRKIEYYLQPAAGQDIAT